MSADVSWYMPMKVILKDCILQRTEPEQWGLVKLHDHTVLTSYQSQDQKSKVPRSSQGEIDSDAIYKTWHLSLNINCVHFPVLNNFLSELHYFLSYLQEFKGKWVNVNVFTDWQSSKKTWKVMISFHSLKDINKINWQFERSGWKWL